MLYKAFIEHLRNGEPKPKWIIAALVLLGLWGIPGALWKISSAGEIESAAWVGLIILSWSSALLIWQSRLWGKRLGQASLILLCLLIFFSVGYESPVTGSHNEKMLSEKLKPVFMPLIDLIIIVIPSYFGFKYLGRLSEKSYKGRTAYEKMVDGSSVGTDKNEPISPTQKFNASLLPFGPFGNTVIPFVLFMTVFIVLLIFMGDQFLDFLAYILIPTVLLFGFGPNLYNQLPSPFEKEREPLESFTGSFSTIILDWSLNNARILIYEDGLEVRIQLSRYFIPYVHLKKIELKKDLFFKGIHIRSQLPGVPNSLSIRGSSAEQILSAVKRYINPGKNTGENVEMEI